MENIALRIWKHSRIHTILLKNILDIWIIRVPRQLNCQICLFYVYCTSKLDFYILDAPISKRLISEQGVSECNTMQYHWQVFKQGVLKFCGFIWQLVHNCIIDISSKMTSVMRCTSNISQIKLRFSDFQWFWKPLEG